MQRLNQLYGGARGDPARRAALAETHRTFTITVAATKRAAGDVVLNAILAGGPERIVRSFCIPAEARDPVMACRDAVAELRRVVNHLLAYP